jgi:uncharacterized membrane protein YbhN (UPF0104 family)
MVSFAILGVKAESPVLLVAMAVFGVAAAGIPAAIAWYRRSLAARVRATISRLPGIGALLDSIATAPAGLLDNQRLLMSAAAVQFVEVALDAATLLVILAAIGVSAAPAVVFAAFALASAAARIIPVPLGLGSFEGALTGMLHVVGVPLEAALTATLLLRAFTLWLPMVPGVWFARRELWDR